MKASWDLPRWPNLIILLVISLIALTGILFHNKVLASSTVLAAKQNFFPASSDLIHYHGRWVTASNRLGKLASLPGSSAKFAVHNTSSIILDLANLRIAPIFRYDWQRSSQIALTPASIKTDEDGPIDILVAINDTTHIYRLNEVYGKALIAQHLDTSTVHRIQIELLQQIRHGTIHLRSILLEEGGSLVPQFESGGSMDVLLAHEQMLMDANAQPRWKTIEILTTSLSDSQSMTQQNEQHNSSWPDLIAHRFPGTQATVLPVANETCFTRLCQTQYPMAARVKDTYFRAGVFGTQLHGRLWSPKSDKNFPAALVIMLGLTDMSVFIHKSNGTKHQAKQFIEDFARSYSNLIQLIRRTAYSPSILDSSQALNHNHNTEMDESYLYNSAPSGVPIFLVIPPFSMPEAGSRRRYIRTLFSQALQRVVNELKWHIGDKKTFVIDTSGWLEEDDFIQKEVADSALTQSGHAKFAYKLSLQLCHYFLDRNLLGTQPQCPFDRHDEYIGNLYVPETASIGRLIEERKVTKMKELFGVIDRKDGEGFL